MLVGLLGRTVLGAMLLVPRIAAAVEEEPLFASTPADDSGTRSKARPPRITGIHLDARSGWSIGLQGYAGLTTLANADGIKGHALVGGISQLRFHYFQVGATLETSDYSGERWRSLGGFAGAFIPFTNWVDLDALVGLAVRSYVSQDTRYGNSGTTARLPELTVYVGIGDRIAGGLIGPRMGAGLLIGIDLDHRDVDWSYRTSGKEVATGSTRFGGTTAGIVMSFGLDVAVRSDR
ncbi:MAG TPA: hypothetical protein VIV60_03490 [Polyangiaceae bacterium]